MIPSIDPSRSESPNPKFPPRSSPLTSPDSEKLDYALKRGLPPPPPPSLLAQDAKNASDGFLVGGYESDNLPGALSPIASNSLHSEHSASLNSSAAPPPNSSSGSGQPPNPTEIDWATRSDMKLSLSQHTIHSDKSYRSRDSQKCSSSNNGGSANGSNRSNRSGKSAKSRLRRKLKREEKRRAWFQRWRRRRLLGSILLTSIYTILFGYTLLVTLGPLILSFGDPMDWCPYYSDGLLEGFHYGESVSLHIDQLQLSKQQQSQQHQQQENGVGREQQQQQRRRLANHGNEFSMDNIHTVDIKEVEINLLKKTSKDVHSDPAKDNNNANHQTTAGGSNEQEEQEEHEEEQFKYENPDYNSSPCHTSRIPSLFYLTLEECDLSRRMFTSVLLGGFIGYERRAADRPAGIRTMALVSLGSCFFTISSQLAFRDSPMTWDASRVTAAIPSGVGFLGAGLIWKGSLSDGSGGEVHQVHGITTAASVWLAAAVGCGAGGALYAVSAYSTALIIIVLRFGPRLYLQNDRGFEDDDEDEDEDEDEDDEEEEYSESDNDANYRKSSDQMEETSGMSQRPNYEMHLMGGQSTNNDTTTLKNNDATKYGAIDVEQNPSARLLHGDQMRHVERMNRLATHNSNQGPQFLSWVTKWLPGKERQQQYPINNPYRAGSRDREVMRSFIQKKKSMERMSSRPSFCT